MSRSVVKDNIYRTLRRGLHRGKVNRCSAARGDVPSHQSELCRLPSRAAASADTARSGNLLEAGSLPGASLCIVQEVNGLNIRPIAVIKQNFEIKR